MISSREAENAMTKLLERAVDAIRQMPPETQDAFARFMFDITDRHEQEAIPAEHRASIEEGLAEAESGQFASDEEVASAFRRFER